MAGACKRSRYVIQLQGIEQHISLASRQGAEDEGSIPLGRPEVFRIPYFCIAVAPAIELLDAHQ